MEGYQQSISRERMTERIGSELGTTPWLTIDQSMIDRFADLTDDHYYIHVDPERAKPHGGTIAHGFLTMSMLAKMAYQACPRLEGSKQNFNYGFDRLRFVSPVPAGSQVRGRFVLHDFQVEPDGRWRIAYDVTVEVRDQPKPALVARWLTAGSF